MGHEIETNDAFAAQLLSRAAAQPPAGPRAYYIEDGDCIEFLFSDESYCGERVDDLLTVYYGRESHEPVGSLIKGITGFIREMVKSMPGFKIEVQDRHVRLEYLFTAGLWKSNVPNKVAVKTYRKLSEMADEAGLSVELPELITCD